MAHKIDIHTLEERKRKRTREQEQKKGKIDRIYGTLMMLFLGVVNSRKNQAKS